MVKKVFNLYRSGYSIIAIVRKLENEHIKSPTGKDKWSKRTIGTILSNEKYIGNVVVGKTYCNDFPYNERKINAGMAPKYLVENNHPSIIRKEIFNQVQSEKLRRSNIKNDGPVSKRKSTHYSMKYCKFDNDK
ncbi:MAG: recombinase family protein [Clostridium sp.]|uniref:recombinase family protein n=1 Tax=Clostridium neonatale TaxID=137838 RepID=UPI001D82E824|nr:recombinase family protein [Clostridium neonatale]MBS5949364.1 recombinase family protein [Clostridium sp.]